MLRLKRQFQKISLTWADRGLPSSKTLRKGFKISLFVHLALFLLFQIRVPFIKIDSATSTPMVFLDAEENPIALLTDDRRDTGFRQRLCAERFLVNPVLAKRIGALSVEGIPTALFSSKERETIEYDGALIPWGFSDECAPSNHSTRIYPLKLTLHHNLKNLQFLDDGSHLFRTASRDTLFSTISFAEVLPQVDFQVVISLKTGRIERSSCQKELVDKRLQGLAEFFLKKLQFSDDEKESGVVSGELSIQFAGTFEKISSLLHWEQVK